MQRAQRHFFSGAISLFAVLIILSGFAVFTPSATSTAQAASNPGDCQIDITFLIDNSGSMDDNGADDTLKGTLRPKLSQYFNRRGFSDDRGALFTFSYEGSFDWRTGEMTPPRAKKHVGYTETFSIQKALGTRGNDGIRQLTFNANASDMAIGIRAASRYARTQSVRTGRTQFIFIAGDEQTWGITDEIRDRIRADGRDPYKIKYYTFALREGISDEPYKRIAQISAAANQSRPRFYKANGFQNALDRDLDRDCTEPPDPTLQFCVVDADTAAPIPGAYLSDTGNPEYIKRGSPNNDSPRLRTGADGCTNDAVDPSYINHNVLTKDATYSVGATAPGYTEESASWTYLQQGGQVVTVEMDKSGGGTEDPSTIEADVDKRGNPSLLTPGVNQTTVEIDFNVKLGKDNLPITNGVVKEELNSSVVIDAVPNFRLLKPDNTEVAIVPVPGTLDAARKKVDLTLPTLTQGGGYVLKFAGRYTGAGDNVGRPIDVRGACTTGAPAGSRVEFKKGDNTDGCVVIPEGIIRQSDGNKITLDADVLFGNKSITLNDKLALGVNGNLVVTGQTVTGNTGTSIVFDRNNVPSGGKLSWGALKANISSVVDRWVRTKAVREWRCPGGSLTIGQANTTTTLYMNTDKEDPTQPAAPFNFGQKPFTMWQFKNPNATNSEYNGCNVEFLGFVTISGTGTLVNKGGQAFIHGSVQPSINQSSQRYALGYVGLQQAGVANSGRVVVYDQSSVKGAIVYTEGMLEVGAIDTTVPAGAVTEKTHRSAFIGQTMKFPALNSLRSNIILGTFPGKNAFPPFVQTYLPQSEAAP